MKKAPKRSTAKKRQGARAASIKKAAPPATAKKVTPPHRKLAIQRKAGARVKKRDRRVVNNERDEGLAREAALAAVLQLVAASPTQLQPIFDAILDNALRLCGGDMGHVFRLGHDGLDIVAMRGASPQFTEWVSTQRSYRPSSDNPLLTVIQHKAPIQVRDVRASARYRKGIPTTRALVDLGGIRTILYVPILYQGEGVGVVVIYRREVRPFTKRHIDFVANFATQAAIAIEQRAAAERIARVT